MDSKVLLLSTMLHIASCVFSPERNTLIHTGYVSTEVSGVSIASKSQLVSQ